jgi:Pin2-interacting protein X1
MASMLVTRKTLTKMGSGINESAGSKVSDFARKQMEKMGWKEGQGLGKNEDGMKKHIKATKREDSAGLGTENMVTEAHSSVGENWWHDAYATNLKSFTTKVSKKDKKDKKNKKDKKDKNESSSSDEKKEKKVKKNKKRKKDDDNDTDKNTPSFDELFAATGGARLGMRARANQTGKMKRIEAHDILLATEQNKFSSK